MSLVVKNLNVVTSSGREILKNCSWEVESGGRLGIIGESGSGKSMSALAVLGLLPEGMKATGSVLLDGEEILGVADARLRRGASLNPAADLKKGKIPWPLVQGAGQFVGKRVPHRIALPPLTACQRAMRPRCGVCSSVSTKVLIEACRARKRDRTRPKR